MSLLAPASSNSMLPLATPQSMPGIENLNDALLKHVDHVISESFQEDLGSGDITSLSIVPADRISQAHLYIKEPAMVAGFFVFARVLQSLDSTVEFKALINEASYISETPLLIAEMTGSTRALLAGERTALNLMQRLSGIASLTHEFVSLASETGISILDTRKTTPGLRALEKWAVAVAGGKNHRFGLFDQILIKDNHLRIAGSVKEAIRRARAAYPSQMVEVEVNNFSQLTEALGEKAERIMLDNMSPEEVTQAVAEINGRAYIEVSGGIKQSNIRDYLIPGVDGISIGALTHSVKSIDISLEIEDLVC